MCYYDFFFFFGRENLTTSEQKKVWTWMYETEKYSWYTTAISKCIYHSWLSINTTGSDVSFRVMQGHVTLLKRNKTWCRSVFNTGCGVTSLSLSQAAVFTGMTNFTIVTSTCIQKDDVEDNLISKFITYTDTSQRKSHILFLFYLQL